MKSNSKSKFLSGGTLIIVFTLLLFVGAVYLNIRTGSKQGASNKTGDENGETLVIGAEGEAGEASSGTDYFTAFRQNRTAARDTEMQYLDSIIASANVDAETLSEAQAKKLEIVENMEVEFAIESQVLAKGFSDVAVTFHDGSVNVIVNGTELSEEQVAQILDIVVRESGEVAKNVKVSTSK